MTTSTYDARLNQFVGFFSTDVLAPYQQQPDKFKVVTDFFEGEISVTSPHFERLETAGRTDDYIAVRFGYRATREGELMLAVWLPDLVDKSPAHLPRWRGFVAPQDTEWLPYEDDVRFSLWVRRYLEGDWDVENGPAFQLKECLALVNGLTLERVGAPLFDSDDPHISYPSAQNTHRYEDAHRDLYGILIDSLNKTCIEAISAASGTAIKCASERSLGCLLKVFPELKTDAFSTPLGIVSEQRRRATHNVRPAAHPMKAFEVFTDDLQRCIEALTLLRSVLEDRFDLDADWSRLRQDALRRLPAILPLPPGTPSSSGVFGAVVGKTIEAVEYGATTQNDRVHRSEIVRLRFTDGSVLSLDTASNAWNVAERAAEETRASDFSVHFHAGWVPPIRRKAGHNG